MRLFSLFTSMGLLALCSFAYAVDTCDSATTQAELTECSVQAYQAADDERL